MSNLKVILNRLLKTYTGNLSHPRYVIAISFFIGIVNLSFQKIPSPEYQLKAVYLFNFTQFVEWPNNSFSFAEAPMIIGILGSDPFGSFLEEAIAEEKVYGHHLLIQHYNSIDEVEECQILFINLADPKKREQIISKLKGRNILTVSDAPDFLHLGGMVRFISIKNKIKLQVNLEAADTSNLVISSKLLRLVEIYNPKKSE